MHQPRDGILPRPAATHRPSEPSPPAGIPRRAPGPLSRAEILPALRRRGVEAGAVREGHSVVGAEAEAGGGRGGRRAGSQGAREKRCPGSLAP